MKTELLKRIAWALGKDSVELRGDDKAAMASWLALRTVVGLLLDLPSTSPIVSERCGEFQEPWLSAIYWSN